MYTISILILLKIYQTRHPDINANAYSAFGVLAFIIFIGVIGVLHGNVLFWVLFSGLHISSCLVLSFQVYLFFRSTKRFLQKARREVGDIHLEFLFIYCCNHDVSETYFIMRLKCKISNSRRRSPLKMYNTKHFTSQPMAQLHIALLDQLPRLKM